MAYFWLHSVTLRQSVHVNLGRVIPLCQESTVAQRYRGAPS
jgi:hypothetical protein